MHAALKFAEALQNEELQALTHRLTIELYGSLGATGKGHGTDKAVLLGLEGETPEQVDPDCIPDRLKKIRESGEILLLKQIPVKFSETKDLFFHRKALPYHANGMRFTATDKLDQIILTKDYYSVGGGFVVSETAAAADRLDDGNCPIPFPSLPAMESGREGW